MNCKIDNAIIQRLITMLPRLLIYKKVGFSYAEIIKILESEYQIKLDSDNPVAYIKEFMRPKRYNNLNPEFSRYLLFRGFNVNYDDFDNGFYIQKYGMIFTKSMYIANNFNSIILTENNFYKLPKYEDCLIAKRLLRLHTIDDRQIVYHRERLSFDDTVTQFTSEDIHLHIMDIFNEMKKEFQEKLFASQLVK